MNKLKCLKIILLFSILICCSGIILAEKTEPAKTWKCFDLLDEKTKSTLAKQENFFASLFQLPNEYKTVSEKEKEQFINQWLMALKGKNVEKVTKAAAYLGIIKAQKAVKPLEEIITTGKRGGRIRWVCTRSLGQISSKSSIPVLIDLLDNNNWNTRFYARISLVEIMGVDFGENKENWKNRQAGKKPQLCTSTECKIETTSTKIQRTFSKDKLDFCLPDIYGRIVDSQDYANVPVLIMSGSCWCGGCQQDAEPLGKIAAKFADRGLATIRTVAGDNELAALDFQKHYRLPFVQLLDTNRSFERRYNPDGWTFMMLADSNGKIVYKVNSPLEKDWRQLTNILDKIFSSSVQNKTIFRDGIAYMPATLQRTEETETQRICERFPSIACGPDGKRYVVYTTNRKDSSDVFMRVYRTVNGTTYSEDVPVAVTDADEYDGTVLIDKQGYVWVCWTSNNVESKNYDIYVMSSKNTTATKLTNSDYDAMHGRMACDKKGRIWLTYYKWHKMGKYSRDKEVYLRRFENNEWSEEIQISPTDVPQHEDHTDPSIATYGNSVVVAWSWDFHPPNKGYSNHAEYPTIFIRTIDNGMNLGRISSVSANKIDVTPVVCVSDNRQIYCAWDSLNWNQKKGVCVAKSVARHDLPPAKIQNLNGQTANVCSPYFVKNHKGNLILFWSETQDGDQWLLKRSVLDNNTKSWLKPETIESEGNPRFCSASYDSKNQLWLAYSAETVKGIEIIIKNLEEDKQKPSSFNNDTTVSANLNRNTEATQKLRKLIDEKYSYRDLRDIDWDKLFDIYTPRLEKAKTTEQFAELAAKMLVRTRDMHLWVKIGNETVGSFKRKINRNYNLELLKKEIPNWKDLSRHVSTACLPDDIGYILIKSWSKNEDHVLKPALNALKNLSDTRALIIDVRPNGGGSEPFAQKVAGCFIDEPVLYAKHVYRNADSETGWGQIQERILKPNVNQPKYRGKIVVLMGRVNMSSCEAFLLMMKQVPNCKLIGEKSYGSSGNPKPYDLGNGVTVWLPSWKALRPDGSCFEGQGIKPDILIKATEKELRRCDPVIERAVKELKSQLGKSE